MTARKTLQACLARAERSLERGLPTERERALQEIVILAGNALRAETAPTFTLRVLGHQRELNGRLALLCHPGANDCAHVGVGARDGGTVAFGPTPGPNDTMYTALSFVDGAIKYLPDVGQEVQITVELKP